MCKLPAPNSDGQFKIDFSVKPEDDLDVMVVSLHNRATNKAVVVGHKDKPDRVDPWTELGVTVDAP